MWAPHRAAMDERAGQVVTLAKDERPLSFGDVLALWRDDEAFRDFFVSALADSPYEAFFWEMPPVDSGMLSRPFECAIIRSGALALIHADDADFAEHLRGPELIATFDNLGGDALLIAPRKIASECYGHIATFLRHAPREQQHALFSCLAREIGKRLEASPKRFWVSTSGLGVPWVHVRLDQQPKYYQFSRYKAGV